MIEWKCCRHCNTKMDIVALSLFDREGKKYGGLFKCVNCNTADTNHFLTPGEIEELKKTLVEKIEPSVEQEEKAERETDSI